MIDKGDWWTSPTEAQDGRLVMVTGRRDIDTFRKNPRFNIRVEVTWRYESDSTGMPDEPTAKLMEDVQDALQAEFIKDPVAVLTGIYTGAGERNWVFYTLSTHIFGRKLNESLAAFDLLPITIYAENDPDWAEYDEMKAASEINPE
ncbi:MAG: DUF695 domain-containing protein [Muribaculaceae bacterium]|nr:DUF695 domain-containing protein [Muribaculaceae bacterium]